MPDFVDTPERMLDLNWATFHFPASAVNDGCGVIVCPPNLAAEIRIAHNRVMLLRADRIELALLSLILDWTGGAPGPTFRLHQYRQAVQPAVEDATDVEVVESLRILHENNLIEIDRYAGFTPVPYDQRESDAFFFTTAEAFRCRARPRARRRQQELTGINRHGIFISHINEERPLALRLQKLLETALSPKPPVFVSSDYDSIRSGEEWYRAILLGIRRSEAVVVLLSPQSIDRRWINFEAGIGLGQESQVIPVVWRGLTKEEVSFPLGQLHARELDEGDECAALLRHLAAVCRLELNETMVAEFIADAEKLRHTIPFSGMKATVFRQGRIVGLSIQNTGNKPLDMIEAELLVAEPLSHTAVLTAHSPVRETIRRDADGVKLRGYKLTTIPSPRPHLGFEQLTHTLIKEAGEIFLTGINISLPERIPEEHHSLPVHFRVSRSLSEID